MTIRRLFSFIALAAATCVAAQSSPGWVTPRLSDNGKEIREPARTELYDSVTGLGVSRDGQLVAVGTGLGVEILWSANGARLSNSAEKLNGVRAVRFTADNSSYWATDDNGRLWHFETRSGKLLRRIKVPEGDLRTIALSPDELAIASGGERTILCVWNAVDGAVRWCTTRAKKDTIEAVAFSPDGSRIAYAGNRGIIRILDAKSGEERTRGLAGDSINALVWDAQGRWIATAGNDAMIRLWNPDGTAAGAFPRGGDWVTALAEFPDGRLVSLDATGTIRTWTLPGGRPDFVIAGDKNGADALAVLPDGITIFTGGADRVIFRWKLPEAGGK